MNRRLLVIVGVFVVGFGVGYGLTFFLVKDPGPAQVADGSLGTAPPVEAGPGAGALAGVAVTAPPSDGAAIALDVGEAAPSSADAGAGSSADSTTAAASDAGEAAAAGTDVAAGENGPPEAPSDPDAEAVAPAVVATGPWWEQCKGRVCTMNFGRISGSVTVREGKIEHGAEVVWRDTFASADRVGSLPAKKGAQVELHAVGMQDGAPVAAWITWGDGARALSGVIALNIGDKVITMTPPAP